MTAAAAGTAGTAKNYVSLFFAIPFMSLFCQVLRRQEYLQHAGLFYVNSHQTLHNTLLNVCLR